MRLYGAHLPPGGAPEGLVILREGFSWRAFLLAPFWLLRHRLWLAFLALALAFLAVAALRHLAGLPPPAAALAGMLLCLLVGLEAAGLRRRALERRGHAELGVVAARDRAEAEHRVLEGLLGPGAAPPASPTQPLPGPSYANPPYASPPYASPWAGTGPSVLGSLPGPEGPPLVPRA